MSLTVCNLAVLHNSWKMTIPEALDYAYTQLIGMVQNLYF